MTSGRASRPGSPPARRSRHRRPYTAFTSDQRAKDTTMQVKDSAGVRANAGDRGHTLMLRGITQQFGSMMAANNISLDVAAGELVALLGPSGCGKTTLLRIIAGFQQQTAGTVLFDGVLVDHLPTAQRGVGIVVQNYALFL